MDLLSFSLSLSFPHRLDGALGEEEIPQLHYLL